MAIDNIVSQLQRDEGYRQFPYRDTRGILTIGYGFNLAGAGLSLTEAAEVLRLRVSTLVQALIKALPWLQRVDAVRSGVLVNMAYNMGLAGLLGFTNMLAAVQAGDWQGAAAEMLNSAWATQVGPRAQRLAEQMRTGEWQ